MIAGYLFCIVTIRGMVGGNTIKPVCSESITMSENNNIPTEDNLNTPENQPAETNNDKPASPQPPVEDQRMGQRLERLGGEPAPVITPEEFARLQKAGQVHIDSRGRVQTSRRSDAEAGVSLRKRRAWYVY